MYSDNILFHSIQNFIEYWLRYWMKSVFYSDIFAGSIPEILDLKQTIIQLLDDNIQLLDENGELHENIGESQKKVDGFFKQL